MGSEGAHLHLASTDAVVRHPGDDRRRPARPLPLRALARRGRQAGAFLRHAARHTARAVRAVSAAAGVLGARSAKIFVSVTRNGTTSAFSSKPCFTIAPCSAGRLYCGTEA